MCVDDDFQSIPRGTPEQENGGQVGVLRQPLPERSDVLGSQVRSLVLSVDIETDEARGCCQVLDGPIGELSPECDEREILSLELSSEVVSLFRVRVGDSPQGLRQRREFVVLPLSEDESICLIYR